MPTPAQTSFAGYSPARPGSIRDLELELNGTPRVFLGVIVSSGSATDNNGTATPFNNVALQLQNGGAGSWAGTLAGKVLLIQASAAGHVLASATTIAAGAQTVATFATVPPAANTIPGTKVQTEERVPFVMPSDMGFLQFIPSSGSANLFVWELL